MAKWDPKEQDKYECPMEEHEHNIHDGHQNDERDRNLNESKRDS